MLTEEATYFCDNPLQKHFLLFKWGENLNKECKFLLKMEISKLFE